MVVEGQAPAGLRQVESGTADSLTFGQLKKIVAQRGSRPKEAKYAFEYAERGSLMHELEDWHEYNQEHSLTLLIQTYQKEHKQPWTKKAANEKEAIIAELLARLSSSDAEFRSESSAILSYLAQGTYAESKSEEHQIHLIMENTALLRSQNTFPTLLKVFRNNLESPPSSSSDRDYRTFSEEVHRNISTVLYFTIQSACGNAQLSSLLRQCREGNFVSYLITTIADLNDSFDDRSREVPMRQLLLLLQQCILCSFGTNRDLIKCKTRQRRRINLQDRVDNSAIITTPLDYANFRSEIISKYPSYDPPPLLPAVENEAMELQHSSTRSSYLDLPIFVEGHWTATPAPSPPPSPKGKKSMYTTDQTIPFILPLGDSVLSTIPQSIEEAAHLFQARQRTSVPLTQLWQEQEHFVKSERGWDHDSRQHLAEACEDTDEDATLAVVEQVYSQSLPHLQGFVSSVVSLMWSMSSLIIPPATQTQADKEADPRVEESVAGTRNWLFNDKPTEAERSPREPPSPGKTTREKEEFREMEIVLKAITGSLLLLQKWFRVSHVLKFEYLSQLLIDADWIHTSHQVLMALNPTSNASANHEDSRRSYFNVCASLSDYSNNNDATLSDSDSEHSSAPRAVVPSRGNRLRSASTPADKEPPAITKFDWKVFFVTITMLRITQKLVKKKAHRNSSLVQAKSWLHLRRPLRIPHDYLQLCCLKLYKGQVPLCSRKWRMSNMKVITQIYMSCRPELREDWIAGTDADTDLEEAKHQEAAIRALVQFYNVRNYPAQSAELGFGRKDEGSDSDEDDFFENEIRRAALVI